MTERSMRAANTLLDYLLWPLLFAAGCLGVGVGFAYGHVPLAFNITYLCMAVAIYFLERWRPHEECWRKNDGQMPADLAHTLFSKTFVQIVVVILTNLGVAAAFGSKSGSGYWPGQWPMFFQVTLALVLGEFGLYWAHRLGHEWMWLWRFHAVHHSVKRLWFFNTGRFHFVDTIKSMVFSAPFLAFSGASGDVLLWFSAITAIIGILTHCNIEMRFGWLNYIFNTSGMHRWHHSMDLREGNKNYGENLMIWDLVFGTYFDDSTRRPPAEIGIKEAMPRTFFGQVIAPFRWHKFQQEAREGRHAVLEASPWAEKSRCDNSADREESPGNVLEA